VSDVTLSAKLQIVISDMSATGKAKRLITRVYMKHLYEAIISL